MDNLLPPNKFYGEIEEIEDHVEKKFKILRPFEVICYAPEDHHFIYYKRYEKQIALGSLQAQKIDQEWKLLETKLPGSIFVQAYENRIDLMRAVIIGPPGTPYSNGLFFFDILFPRNYPDCPPRVSYDSYGLDLNPSLNSEGKINLSLLESPSMFGCNRNKWDPKESSILDVLVAIQGSILTSNPVLSYISSESKSLKYNKSAFFLVCEGMIRILRKPPRNFEVFVAGHFRTRAHSILMKCKGNVDDTGYTNKLFLKLLRAFEKNGTYCQHHLCWLKLEEEEEEVSEKSEDSEFGFGLQTIEKSGNSALGFALKSLNPLKNLMLH